MRKRLYILIIAIMALLASSFGAAAAQGAPGAQAEGVGHKALTTTQAVVLGVIEGFTEYLPVSSTGHLLLAEQVMGIGKNQYQTRSQQEQTKEAADAYTICIQAGAILAVLWLYFGRIKQILKGLAGRDEKGRRLLINVVVGFLPAAVLGLLFNKVVKSYLFGPWPVVAAWLVGGVAILAVSCHKPAGAEERRPGMQLDEMTWRMALIIGFGQCLAMWPGVSRSLATIVGSLLVGLGMEAAVEYTFLLGVVTLGAATAYDTVKHGQVMLQTFDHFALIVGVGVAFIAAVISVKWMVGYLTRHGLEMFGYYRVGIAVITTIFLLTTQMIWI